MYDLTPHKTPRKVLDHGHVQLIDTMGDDARVCAAARLSYEGGKTISDDRALIRYMMRHRHTSPFEHCKITLDIKLPIFVARQLVRHRMANLNEVSARYTKLPEEWYTPELAQICAPPTKNKQGKSEALPEYYAKVFADDYDDRCQYAFDAYDAYREGAHNPDNDDETHPVANETARMVLPLSTYTHWWWTFDAHNLMHMLALRLDEHAQWETRQYAQAIADIVRDWMPLTWEAFEDYRLGAVTFSRQEMKTLRAMTTVFLDRGGHTEGVLNALRESGCTQRELQAFGKALWPKDGEK